MELTGYLQDGANWQARATLAVIQGRVGDGLEGSWNNETKRYDARPLVARWENCREQGYVVSLCNSNYSHQINIAFFEHRNSDSICAVRWLQKTINSPTIDTAEFGNVYKDKYDVSKEVGYACFSEMAHWVVDELERFWTSK